MIFYDTFVHWSMRRFLFFRAKLADAKRRQVLVRMEALAIYAERSGDKLQSVEIRRLTEKCRLSIVSLEASTNIRILDLDHKSLLKQTKAEIWKILIPLDSIKV